MCVSTNFKVCCFPHSTTQCKENLQPMSSTSAEYKSEHVIVEALFASKNLACFYIYPTTALMARSQRGPSRPLLTDGMPISLHILAYSQSPHSARCSSDEAPGILLTNYMPLNRAICPARGASTHRPSNFLRVKWPIPGQTFRVVMFPDNRKLLFCNRSDQILLSFFWCMPSSISAPNLDSDE